MMGCIHIHFREGKPIKVTQHDFNLKEETNNGVLHIEDNKVVHFFTPEVFEKNHSVDRNEIDDIPYNERFDIFESLNHFTDVIQGISLCPRCEKEIEHNIKISSSHLFIGKQKLRFVKHCADCDFSWIAEINVLATRTPVVYVLNDETLIPDETTARQAYLDSLNNET